MFLDDSVQQRRGNRIALLISLGILTILIIMILFFT